MEFIKVSLNNKITTIVAFFYTFLLWSLKSNDQIEYPQIGQMFTCIQCPAGTYTTRDTFCLPWISPGEHAQCVKHTDSASMDLIVAMKETTCSTCQNPHNDGTVYSLQAFVVIFVFIYHFIFLPLFTCIIKKVVQWFPNLLLVPLLYRNRFGNHCIRQIYVVLYIYKKIWSAHCTLFELFIVLFPKVCFGRVKQTPQGNLLFWIYQILLYTIVYMYHVFLFVYWYIFTAPVGGGNIVKDFFAYQKIWLSKLKRFVRHLGQRLQGPRS